MLVLTTACALMRGAVARFDTNRTGPRGRRGEVAYLYYSLFFFLYNSMSIVTAALWRRFCSMSFSRVFFGALILVCRLCTTGGLCFPFCYAQNVCFGVCVVFLLVGGHLVQLGRGCLAGRRSGPGR